MYKPFFEDKKMPKDDKKVQESKGLDADQKKLVTMMIPVVQEYFKSESTKVTGDVKVAIEAKVEEIEDVLVGILAQITIEQNRKMSDSIAAFDENPSYPY